MIFLAIKTFFIGAWPIFSKHWRVILPLLILAYCLYKYNDAVSDKVKAQQEYAAHLQADKDALIKRDAENKLNAILAQKKTDADKLAFAEKLKAANLDRDKIQKDLLNEKANINRIVANARKLQNNTVTTTTDGLPIISVPTDLFADRSDYNAIVTLDQACKVTTQDYNELMRKWLDHCTIYKCEHLEEVK